MPPQPTAPTAAPRIIRPPGQIQAELAKAREAQEAPADARTAGYGEGCVDMFRWLTGLSDEAPAV